MFETVIIILVFMACFILLDDTDRKESKRRKHEYNHTPELYEEYISGFKEETEKKIFATIDSCKTITQLNNAHMWALKIVERKEEEFLIKYPNCNMSFINKKFFSKNDEITKRVLDKLTEIS